MDTEATAQLTIRFKQMRTRTLLDQAPDLVVHMLADVVPGGGAQGARVGGTKEIPLPLNTQALEDANALYAQLVNWSTSHARSLYIMPPASALGWWQLDQDCDGFPSWATNTGGVAAELTRSVVKWLNDHEDGIAQLPVADAYWDDIRDLVEPAAKRYKAMINTQIIAAEDCPICAKHKTVIVNEDPETSEIVVACTFCGYPVPHAYRKKYLEWKTEEPQWT